MQSRTICRLMVITTAACAALAACGGEDTNSSTATSDASTSPSADVSIVKDLQDVEVERSKDWPAVTTGPGLLGPPWAWIANPGGTMSFPGLRKRVRYGRGAATTYWLEGWVDNGDVCNDALFIGGAQLDPGTSKYCEVNESLTTPVPTTSGQPFPASLVGPVPAPGAAPWQWIANTSGTMSFAGLRKKVRYGRGGPTTNWLQGFVDNGGTCNDTLFVGGSTLDPGFPKYCEVDVTSTVPIGLPPPGSVVPLQRLDVGSGAILRGPAINGVTPVNKPESAFRTRCVPSHINFEDPIVYPNNPLSPTAAGLAHMHLFFGNTNADRYLAPSNIRTTGNSTCDGGTLNRSAYWVPTILNGANQPVIPIHMLVYYKSGGSNIPRSLIESELPAGLRIVSGNSEATVPQEPGRFGFACISPDGNNVTAATSTIQTCAVGWTLRQKVTFPQCWNGALDSADHKSHMAFPVTSSTTAVCPSTHPRAIPEITFNVDYVVKATDNLSTWRLSSDHAGQGRGQSNHGDWFNGWDTATTRIWLANCTKKSNTPNTSLNDCLVNLLGDGTELYRRN
jgi:Domain of unknown function (DUF1996)